MSRRKQKKSGTERRRKLRRAPSKRQPPRAHEWVGAKLEAPFEVDGSDDVGASSPTRPLVTLWIELPRAHVVGYSMNDPREPGSFADVLREAMACPIEGPPRRPGRVRVAKQSLAEEVRRAVPGLTVDVAPTPEADEVMHELASELADDFAQDMRLAARDEAGDEAWDHQPRELPPGASPVHQLDERLTEEMIEFAIDRFGKAWRRAAEPFYDPYEALPLFAAWSVYQHAVRGKPIVAWFLEARREELSQEELAWLQAQQDAWLSIWEITAIEPGASLTLRDLLTAETRTVHEVSASQTLAVWDVLLARVVDVPDGTSVLCGLHPHALPPTNGTELARLVRRKSRFGQRAVLPERLRNVRIGTRLIELWEDALEELNEQQATPPRLTNTDGEDLLLTVDHFSIAPNSRDQLDARLTALDDVEVDNDGAERRYTFVRPNNPKHADWDNTVIGSASLSRDRFRVETNSVARADALRKRVQSVAGSLIQHRTRQHSDPTSSAQPAPRGASASPVEPSTEQQEILRLVKEQHYAGWPDEKIPALGGKSPRQAVKTKRGRDQVDLLLKELENLESRSPAAGRFDVATLRTQLGLDE